MELGFVALVAFVLGIVAGLGIGRYFCKWHHKNDGVKLGPPTPAEDAATIQYVNKQSGCCQPGTIGEEIEGCDRNNCCKDE